MTVNDAVCVYGSDTLQAQGQKHYLRDVALTFLALHFISLPLYLSLYP